VSSSPENRSSYQFGEFRIDRLDRVLIRDGQLVPLTPKVFDLLLLLIENHGHVVGKDRLMSEVWPNTYVEEGNLTQNISVLRKALSGAGHQYIQTVPRYGYRFVGHVRELLDEDEIIIEEHSLARVVVEERDSSRAVATPEPPIGSPFTLSRQIAATKRVSTWILVTAPALALTVALAYFGFVRSAGNDGTSGPTAPRSLAVLPFQNLDATPGHEFLGLGMTDALISRLSNLHRANVRPTSAVQKYSGSARDAIAAGKELRVDSVLAGTMQEEKDRIRVSVQLIDTKEGKTVWARSFDEKATNVFAVEDAIAEQIALSVIPRLSAEDRQRVTKHYTEDPAAHELYLQGRFYLNKFTEDGTRLARKCFEEAIAKDGHYALAYSGLAESYAFGEIGLPPQEAFPKAREAATRALELDEDVGEAHAVLAQVGFLWDWDWAAAEKQFKRALDFAPADPEIHHMYAHYLTAMGRFDEALAESQRLLELNPLSPAARNHLGWHYLYAHQFDQAIEQYKLVLSDDPNFTEAHRQLAEAYAEKGLFDNAIAETLKRWDLLGRTNEVADLQKAYVTTGWKGFWRKRLELFTERAKHTYMAPTGSAVIYAQLGNKSQALDDLERAYREHDHDLVYMKVDYVWDSLRSEPRFQELLKRMRLAG
jgi:DNA-binding winged helix-turn-helix (wHTH) protein/TolB-like protein/Tfp pilus assembly protein PilF